ncbi:MAG: hypothetical protein M3R04_02445 [bacterium]|nr:hypothetical protein [bacterium]
MAVARHNAGKLGKIDEAAEQMAKLLAAFDVLAASPRRNIDFDDCTTTPNEGEA